MKHRPDLSEVILAQMAQPIFTPEGREAGEGRGAGRGALECGESGDWVGNPLVEAENKGFLATVPKNRTFASCNFGGRGDNEGVESQSADMGPTIG
jgi:hypothetical protein